MGNIPPVTPSKIPFHFTNCSQIHSVKVSLIVKTCVLFPPYFCRLSLAFAAVRVCMQIAQNPIHYALFLLSSAIPLILLPYSLSLLAIFVNNWLWKLHEFSNLSWTNMIVFIGKFATFYMSLRGHCRFTHIYVCMIYLF